MESEARHLRLVVALADTASMTRAAESLHVTPSALSHQLRDLESRLAARLFHRVGKRLVPTAAGAVFLESARRALDIVGGAERGIKDAAAGGHGRIRLATECYTCYHWLPPLIKRYRERHPHVDISIDPSATADPAAALIAGRLDVAVMSSPVKDRRLAARPLFDDELVAVLPPSHPLVSRARLTPRDFSDETLLLYSPVGDSSAYRHLFGDGGIRPKAVQVIQLTEAMIELVQAGLGVAVLARWAIAPWLADGRLAGVPLGRGGLSRRWSAVTLRDAAGTSHLSDFIDMAAVEARRAIDRLAATPPGRRGRRATRESRRR